MLLCPWQLASSSTWGCKQTPAHSTPAKRHQGSKQGRASKRSSSPSSVPSAEVQDQDQNTSIAVVWGDIKVQLTLRTSQTAAWSKLHPLILAGMLDVQLLNFPWSLPRLLPGAFQSSGKSLGTENKRSTTDSRKDNLYEHFSLHFSLAILIIAFPCPLKCVDVFYDN